MPEQEANIIIPEEVTTYEGEYRRPALSSTPRQVSWARLIRGQVLSEVLPKLMDFTAALPQGKRADTFAALDQIRSTATAKKWIEEYRHFRARPDILLPKLAEMMAAQRRQEKLRATQAQQAKVNRSVAHAAKKFDQQYSLPKITGASSSQESFGRRCRYSILTLLAPAELEQLRPFLNDCTAAKTWIDAFLSDEKIGAVIERHKMRSVEKAELFTR